MSGQRFERGDAVATLHRIGNGLEKRRVGEVVDVGAQGARVKFIDGETLWLPAGKLWHVVDRDGRQELTKERPAPAAKPRPVRLVEPAAPAETPPLPAPPAVPLAAIEASGADPFALWMALGRELVEKQRRALADAEAAEAAAAASVASAEALLSEEVKSLGRARAAVADARSRLAEIAARVGVTDAPR